MPSRNNRTVSHVDDPKRPECRHFVNGNCKRGRSCWFYHPKIITTPMRKNSKRELGKCYCGSSQLTLINKRLAIDIDNPIFFVVCGRTRKSIKRCM